MEASGAVGCSFLIEEVPQYSSGRAAVLQVCVSMRGWLFSAAYTYTFARAPHTY